MLFSDAILLTKYGLGVILDEFLLDLVFGDLTKVFYRIIRQYTFDCKKGKN